MLQIAESFRFPELTNYVFTMDVKSLYTVIPNQDGLLALEHFLNKRSVLQPPTHTLLRLAELVLTLNTFAFNGNYYEQVGGVAMGSIFGPNYACLFMGRIEGQIFEQYPGRTPDLFKRCIDDIMGAASCSKREIEDFASFVNNFHPNLKFTWSISEEAVSFLDLCIKPSGHRLTTTIHYKETDTHSYLNYFSSHPVRCKQSIPFSQLLRLKRICSEADDFNERSKEMVKNIMTKNLGLLKDDPQTGEIFQPVRILCAYRRDSNLRDALVRSTLGDERTVADRADFETSPCARPRCKTCDYTNATPVINTPGGSIHVRQRYTCTTTHAVYIIQCRACAKCYIGETGRRLAAWLIDSESIYDLSPYKAMLQWLNILICQDIAQTTCLCQCSVPD
ncbi:hypothetical protein ACROYT_G006285 [Oculina patagonica]